MGCFGDAFWIWEYSTDDAKKQRRSMDDARMTMMTSILQAKG